MKLMRMTLPPSPIKLVENENAGKILEATGEPPLPQFTLVAYTGVKVQTKEFPCPVVVDLQGIDIPVQNIPVRFEHKSFQGVGHTEKIVVVGWELLAEGLISRDTSWARDVAKSAKNGFPWQASMGGPIHEVEYVPFGQKATVNGQTFEGEIYVIRKMTLKEISFVDLGADPNTSARIEFQYEEGQPRMKIDMNTETFVDTNTTATSESKPEAAPVRIEAAQVDTGKMMLEFQQKMMIDQRRIAAIEKIGGGKFPDLEAKAIEDGWAVQKFQMEYQAKTMPDASTVSVTGVRQYSCSGLKPTALEAIALASSGSSMAFLESQYDEPTLDQIDRFRGVGIQEFVSMSCGQYMPHPKRDIRGWLEAAFSSASLPGILSNIANKMLLEGFLTMDDTWKKIVKIASVNDFKTHTRYRLNGAFKFEKVAADGEIKHGQIGEENFTQKIETYGIMFGINRQMIIDDDLAAFAEIPQGIGVGAGEAISDAVWKLVLANPKQKDGKLFFSAAHKNLFSDVTAKLDIDGLTAAELKFSEQERSAGRPLGIPAKLLLVPTALKVAAELLMKSLTVQVTTEEGKAQPTDNPHAGKYEVVSTPYLASPAWEGNSAKDWYLLADPRQLPALEVAFLGGQDRPTVERADADFNKLGIQFRGYIDFGVKEQDHRGALKMSPTG